MPGLHYCSECWYFNGEGDCDAKHSDASARKLACTDFASKDEEDYEED